MSVSAGISRVSHLLSNQVMLSSLTRTNTEILRAQIQMATGKAISRPSDDALGASAISVFDEMIERRDQRIRNLSYADSMLANLDQALGDATNLVQEAREVGLSQIGIGSDGTTRAAQATVIDSMLKELLNLGNREFGDVHLFAGNRTSVAPFANLLSGIVYRGTGSGLRNDLATTTPFEITMSGEQAFGALSKRVEGDRNLDPTMDDDTRLLDLNGARGFGISLGTIRIDVNGNEYDLDLSGCATIGDVANAIEDCLNANEPGALDAGGVAIDPVTENRLRIDLNAGYTVTFAELTSGTAAADLGLSTTAFEDGVNETGDDLDPRLTSHSEIADLTGVSVPLGPIRIANAGQTRDLDLSSATTIEDIQNAVANLRLGVRVEIAESGDRINFINELSGGSMSIAEISGGSTATDLGVRSLTYSTRLEDFNDGRGVHIVSDTTSVSGPTAGLDFRVTLKDGRAFDVNLGGSITVQDVLDRINTAAAAAGITVPGEFEAGLVSDGNGILLTDNTVGTTTSVTALNQSFAAADLGILGATTSATLVGEDRATVAVDSVFSHLISLRDALHDNDERGIEFATSQLEGDIDRLAQAWGESGARAQRITRMTEQEEDLRIQDMALRSEVQDLDFAEAAMRFAALQTQLQANLAIAGRTSSLSLIDFLR